MDGRQKNMMAAEREDDDYNQQQQQRQRQEQRQGVEAEEARGSLDTLREQPIRIQTQLSHSNSASPPRHQWGGQGSGGVLMSAQSDMSDRTVFDWQAQDHHHHYPPPKLSSFPGCDDRRSMPGIDVHHSKDKEKWIPSPPLPLPLHNLSKQDPTRQQRQYSTTPFQQLQQRQSWPSTIATHSRNWARQTRRWLQRYLDISTGTTSPHHHHRHDQHSPSFVSNDSLLASASSSTSTSTIVGEGALHSRHHPYFQGLLQSASTPSTSSSATFLSPGEIESARQYKKDEERYFWRPPLKSQWPPRSFSFPFRIPRSWGGFGRGRNKTNSTTPTLSTTAACLRRLTRRRKRTLHKWAWMASLMLVLTLAIYIAIVGISRIHGYLANDGGDNARVATAGGNGDLVSKGQDIWKKVGMGRVGAIRNAEHGAGVGGVSVESGVHGKTATTNQDGYVPDPISPPAVTVAVAGSPIWTRRAEDEMDDPLDVYPDEDEDDPQEAASFMAWLAQATLMIPTIQQQEDQEQRLPPQQYQEYHEPPRPPPSRRQQQQGGAGQETFLLEPERYFTYMPYAGISNQFYGMLRAMSIARALDRTLILPPITSSSHDKSRQNQAWSEFFDLNEFRRRTGLKVIEYQDLRDRGSFRGPTGVLESQSSVGASWNPPWAREASAGETKATLADKRGSKRYQHNLGTGTSTVDMTLPCHVTCGFGSKRNLDFTAKAFIRQWGFQYKKEMLPKSSPTASSSTPPGSLPIGNEPIDQSRDFDRIVQALQDDSLRGEGFLCISNTYKIQISPTTIPAGLLVDSIEWHEFGQHLLFQPRLTQFVDEFLVRTFGERPGERAKYGNDTFWISSLPLSGPWTMPVPEPLPVPSQAPAQPQVDSPQLQLPSQPLANDVDNTPPPSSLQSGVPTDSRVSVSYAATVDLTPWPPLRPLIQHTFFMIHVRRGDFESYCKKEYKDGRFDQCLPSNEAYSRVINELQQRALRDGGGDAGDGDSGDSYGVGGLDGKNDGAGYDRMQLEKQSVGRKPSRSKRRRIPVLVATNENRSEELARLRQLGRRRKSTRNAGVNSNRDEQDAVTRGGGRKDKEELIAEGEEEEEEEWIILDHEEMKTVERLGVFGPMMVEQLLMAEAEALVGVKMSTFSRVGGYRQRDWYQRRILYM